MLSELLRDDKNLIISAHDTQLDFFWFNAACQVSLPILIISIRNLYIRDNPSELCATVVSEEPWGDAETETGSSGFTDSGLFLQNKLLFEVWLMGESPRLCRAPFVFREFVRNSCAPPQSRPERVRSGPQARGGGGRMTLVTLNQGPDPR